jgi:hypothetical protein
VEVVAKAVLCVTGKTEAVELTVRVASVELVATVLQEQDQSTATAESAVTGIVVEVAEKSEETEETSEPEAVEAVETITPDFLALVATAETHSAP